MSLTNVVPWGRTLREYKAMFLLEDGGRGRILDCAAGPASFVAEWTGSGGDAVACDPLYEADGEAIRSQFEASVDSVMVQVRASPEKWVWRFHAGPDELLAERRSALQKFLDDYDGGRRGGRYVVASLPSLPFAPLEFDLALCSHFLLLYSDHFSEEFHVQSIRELCRVAREVLVFPLLTLAQEQSRHLAAVERAALDLGRRVTVERAGYGLQRGGDELLRIAML